MSYALVGSLGAVSTSASGGAPSPAFGQATTANNLLVLWLQCQGGTTAPVISGWTRVVGAVAILGSNLIDIYYKIAAGSDAAPSIGAGGAAEVRVAQLGEFSGNSTEPIAVLDQAGGGVSSAGTTPFAVSNAFADGVAAELFIYNCLAIYTTAATKTLTTTENNGMTAHDTTNNAVSAGDHYALGYGITTSNAAADQCSLAFTTTKISGVLISVASFHLASFVEPGVLIRRRRAARPSNYRSPQWGRY